jgi:hypothetical protein
MKRFVIRESRKKDPDYVYSVYDRENKEPVAMCDAGIYAELMCQAFNEHNEAEHI